MKSIIVSALFVVLLTGCGAANHKLNSSSQGAIDLSVGAFDPASASQIKYYLIPSTIQFFSSDCTLGTAGCNQTMILGHGYKFIFFLDIQTGEVRDASSNHIYQISTAELAQLSAMIHGSVLATANDFAPASQGLCAISDVFPYAILNTDRGPIGLSGDLCTEVDLFRVSTGKPVGMVQFIQNLQNEISAAIGIGVL